MLSGLGACDLPLDVLNLGLRATRSTEISAICFGKEFRRFLPMIATIAIAPFGLFLLQAASPIAEAFD